MRSIFCLFILIAFSGLVLGQKPIEKEKMVGTWQQVDSLGNPLLINNDITEYKIITPETFTVLQAVKSKGFFIGLFFGTYVLENETYIESIVYSNPMGVRLNGQKNLFYVNMKDDLLYIWGINNKFKQIWKKLDKLPLPEIVPTKSDVSSYFKKQYDFSNYKFTGGDGSSQKRAVVISSRTESEGIAAQYYFIGKKYGMRDVEWKVLSQECQKSKSRMYDSINIKLLKTNEIIKVWFDITAYYGKF